MRLANFSGRAALLVDGRAVDVERASNDRFSSDPQSVFDRWDEFVEWAASVTDVGAPNLDTAREAPVPRPRQVLAVGMNYRDHAAEIGLEVPVVPSIFTKFPTCIVGPDAMVTLPAVEVDWEVELVVVIGRTARNVEPENAWSFAAGVTVGQDLSQRAMQMAGPSPQQFSLAKSYAGFGPIGPELVTIDELGDPDDLALGCQLNGEAMQRGRTRDMVFSVPELIGRLSAVLTLTPGDLIFTGTPPGVGWGRKPPRFVSPGDELISFVEGVGEMRTRFVGKA
jgi:2-keto-4-pentenoate hydratase/2-oxohepta-3-ene-1,7-dioic acid hydratase in catechol pathway